MSAQVVSYSADAWDTKLSIKVECLMCHVEWGWSYYSPETYQTLKELALTHNEQLHGHPRRLS